MWAFGTGLGLAVVFGVVKQSGGHIDVASHPGRGTLFSIYFPHTTSLPKTEVRSLSPHAARGGSETVLVVDDDEQVRHLACATLRKSGYHVLDAATGGDALLVCEQHDGPIHLVLTDIVMPRLAGDRLSQRLTAMRPTMLLRKVREVLDGGPLVHGREDLIARRESTVRADRRRSRSHSHPFDQRPVEPA